MNGVHINNGDTIAIIGKEIVLADPDRTAAALRLADTMLTLPDKFMLTVFLGADSVEEEREAIERYVKENYPSFELYFIEGGQEIYPYIFMVE
jgi:dihydroxyacetone kinase-like predicted kinase